MSHSYEPPKAKAALYVIIIRSRRNGYFSCDFAMPGEGVWHSFNHGDVTGATLEVVWSRALPLPKEVYDENASTDGKDS